VGAPNPNPCGRGGGGGHTIRAEGPSRIALKFLKSGHFVPFPLDGPTNPNIPRKIASLSDQQEKHPTSDVS